MGPTPNCKCLYKRKAKEDLRYPHVGKSDVETRQRVRRQTNSNKNKNNKKTREGNQGMQTATRSPKTEGRIPP